MHDPLDHLMMKAALEASRVICAIYATPFEARSKADGSPVTEADARAEAAICAVLAETGIPVLAEEQAAAGQVPEIEHRFFCVDPLDGTKEFLKRNGEFTVNIALIEHGRPVRGVIVAPALGTAFSGGPSGAFEYRVAEAGLAGMTPLRTKDHGPLHIMGSRSHGHDAFAALARDMNAAGDVSVGSSLKFCLLARGDARLYPRFTPTAEWDTAAGQAVLEAAGGSVVALTGEPLGYGKADTAFLNPFFVAASSPALAREGAAAMRRVMAGA